jgi:ABC-2 type transport system ATP-binding protein
MENILEVRNVSKWFSGHQALNSVSFDVPKGTIFGLLGPNGAGKTTLIRIITNIMQADQGQVLLDGQDTTRVPRGTIGYMPEERGLYKKMKVFEQLFYFCKLRQMDSRTANEEIEYWLRKMDLLKWAQKNIEDLSKGMQQKVQFIATVMHRPPLLILDEPFSGLDPVNSELIMEVITELNKKGTSIIFSTHRMEQVEEICQYIVLINKGRNVLENQVSLIKQSYKEGLYNIAFDHNPEEQSLPEGIKYRRSDGASLIVQAEQKEELNAMIRSQINSGNNLTHMEEILPSIHDIFIKTVAGEK